ncbi:MAG: tetratricopeptide repeat protein, partial [Planctomycetota bacterium]|nr:tetratricopeptide repeat protein [Planctomycetota bacterium]
MRTIRRMLIGSFAVGLAAAGGAPGEEPATTPAAPGAPATPKIINFTLSEKQVKELEERMKKAARELTEKNRQEARQDKDLKYDPKDPRSKEEQLRAKQIQKANLAMIKEMKAKADDAFKNQRYREAAQFYGSIALADVPGSETMAEEARAKFVEMEKLAQGHLDAAEDFILQRQYVKAVEELRIVVNEFPFTDAAPKAAARLRGLQSKKEVAAYCAYAEAEGLEQAGNFRAAIRAYRDIVARHPESVPAVRAEKRLAVLEKDAAVQEKVKAEIAAEAEAQAPAIFNIAENFMKSGMNDSAREKLNMIIEKYPGTPQAEEAKKKLDALKG